MSQPDEVKPEVVSDISFVTIVGLLIKAGAKQDGKQEEGEEIAEALLSFIATGKRINSDLTGAASSIIGSAYALCGEALRSWDGAKMRHNRSQSE